MKNRLSKLFSFLLGDLSGRAAIFLLLSLLTAVLAGFFSAYVPAIIALAIAAFLVLGVIIWRSPFLGLLIIALSLPLERIGALEYSGLTIRLSQIFLIITGLAWFFKGVVRKKLGIAANPLIIPLIVFACINCLSVINAQNIERSVTVLVFTIFTMFLGLIVPNLVRSRADLKKIIYVILVSAFLVSLFGIYQFVGDIIGLPPEITGLRELYTKEVLGFPRVQSTAYEPLYFANYLLIPLGLISALFLMRGREAKPWVTIPLTILFTTNLFLTISRGGYFGYIILVFVLAIIYLKNLLTPKKIIGIALIAVAVGILVVRFLGATGTVNFEVYTEHVSNIFYGASFQERIETFDKAKEAYWDHPLVGIGVGAFGPFSAVHPYVMPDGGFQIVNNEFIEILAETGMLGLLSFLVILAILAFRSIKAIRVGQDKYLKAVMAGLLASFMGILVQYQTFSTLYIMHVWFLFGLMIAVQNMIFKTKEPKR